MSSSVLTLASTYRMKLVATKDGEVWDLTAATVTLLLRDPSGNATTKAASLLVAADGTAYYDTLTTDLDEVGVWSRAWRVVQGSVDVTSVPTLFTVVRAP